jgi:hypothetical protein
MSMREKLKKVPLWKWILIIILILSMPLFFLANREQQTQSAIQKTVNP